jgi:outer membrane protein OmpA-like peptidoglycan-associated protein
LTALFDAKAVFFGDGLGYRDPAISSATLGTIATAIKTAGLAVRVVGHTDGSGTPAANLTLSLQRAAKVRDDLIGRGVPEKLLTSIGRADTIPIAVADAPLNPNRRVTFELGFDGEMAP